jgi:hypothetical protein
MGPSCGSTDTVSAASAKIPQEADRILRGELSAHRRANGAEAEREQVLVEVPKLRGKDQRLDASGFGCLGERRDRRLACGIGISCSRSLRLETATGTDLLRVMISKSLN